jgi:peptidoglycan LD-endopeptidase LytH
VKTFGFLVAGWAVGGALVVLGSAGGSPAVLRAAGPQATPFAHVTAGEPPAGRLAGRQRYVVIPVVGVTSSQLHDDFSQPRSGGRTHQALDILAPRGTPVVAAVDGTIRKLFFSNAGGITIYQFDEAEERVYYYAHLDRYANGLAEGLMVRQGTVIGYVGTTGNTRGTPHLHFAVEILPATKEWSKGTPINPYPLLAP